jgi:hypothetical protein
MKRISLCALLGCVLGIQLTSAQEIPDKEVQIRLHMNQQPMELGKKYALPQRPDSVQIETLKFYLSDVQFYQDENWVASLGKKHLLIDAERPESQRIALPPAVVGTCNRISFQLGVDSLTQVSGALGDDLDPTNGMYWTWQSGYIHVKLEGVAAHCPARNHRFQFHLGGYQSPVSTLRQVSLAVENADSLVIEVAVADFFTEADLSETYQVMSPGEQAVALSRRFAALFSVLP